MSDMTSARWQRIKAVFNRAAELDHAAREPFVQVECGSDTGLRAEVMALLDAADAPGNVLDKSAIAWSPGASAMFGEEVSHQQWLGHTIGPWRIVDALGQGGMGEVWRAVRDDGQFDKSVAIKLVRSGSGSEHAQRLFFAERRILAGLEHPNIAHLIDGGVTVDGVPYLVMELVEGEPIDKYCRRLNMNVDSCLELFRTVCAAVQYAHQHLVVHRDLKPGNILVTASGTVKLLDFGVAKLIEPMTGPVSSEPSIAAERIFTPEYASPEQLLGDGITTASDIYSLGVVLYVLLTGCSPYGVTGSPHELMRAICDTDPPKPSTTLRTVPATPEAVRRARQARGDADNIVLKALRKEPDRRYATAAELSEDIRRHLAGLPVSAHADSLAYRMGKLIGRHRIASALTVVAVSTLVISSVVTYRQAAALRLEQVRSDRHFASVRSLANSLIFEVHDAVQDLPGSMGARKLLVKNAVSYLDALATEAGSGSDGGLQRDLGIAYRKIGELQGRAGRPNTGDRKGAEENYSRAIRFFDAILASQPNDSDTRIELATALELRGWNRLLQGAAVTATEDAVRALAMAKASQMAVPEPARTARMSDVLARAYMINAWTSERNRRLDDALSNARAAIEVYEQLATLTPLDRLQRYELGGAHHSASQFLVQSPDTESQRAALASLQRALALHQTIVDDNPTDILGLTAMAQNHIQMGIIATTMNDTATAINAFRLGIGMHERVAALEPEGMAVRPRRVDALIRLGDVLSERGNLTDALVATQSALDLSIKWQARSDLALLKVLAARSQSRLGKLNAAMANDKRSPEALRHRYLQEAEKWYSMALPALTAQREQGLIKGMDEAEPELAAAGLAKVKAELRGIRPI